jgi:hypothetical protein
MSLISDGWTSFRVVPITASVFIIQLLTGKDKKSRETRSTEKAASVLYGLAQLEFHQCANNLLRRLPCGEGLGVNATVTDTVPATDRLIAVQRGGVQGGVGRGGRGMRKVFGGAALAAAFIAALGILGCNSLAAGGGETEE